MRYEDAYIVGRGHGKERRRIMVSERMISKTQTLKGLRGMDGKQCQREMERRGGQEQQREERGEENRSKHGF
jgi:hypothetical protein